MRGRVDDGAKMASYDLAEIGTRGACAPRAPSQKLIRLLQADLNANGNWQASVREDCRERPTYFSRRMCKSITRQAFVTSATRRPAMCVHNETAQGASPRLTLLRLGFGAMV